MYEEKGDKRDKRGLLQIRGDKSLISGIGERRVQLL